MAASVSGYNLGIHMVRSREGEDLAGANMAGANMVSRFTLQVYVTRTECPVVESYACRDHRSFRHFPVVDFIGKGVSMCMMPPFHGPGVADTSWCVQSSA